MGLGNIGGGIAAVLVCLGIGFALTRLDLKKWWDKHQQRSALKRQEQEQERAAYEQQQAQWQYEEQLRAQEAERQRQSQPLAYQPPSYAQTPLYNDEYAPQQTEPPVFYEETIVQNEEVRPVMNWDRRAASKGPKAGKKESRKDTNKKKPVMAVSNLPDPDFEEDTLPWEEKQVQPVASSGERSNVKPMKLRPAPVASQTPPLRKAAMQETTMMSGEKLDAPKVKLPPRKQDEPRQMEMDLPAPYTYPSLNLLKAPAPARAESHSEDLARSAKLEETLESFRIPAKVKNVTHGPAIARFELEIASGINVSRVANIDKNIAMNLEVKSVRIEAPIPGKSLVGVEVPNKTISAVTLREVLESPEMRRMESPLAVALGKDIAGQPIVCDLERMPHLLIAGATGSGKSVCINAIINSIIYRATPQQVKMILIDPKMVELQCYNCLPHLLVPVVSDPHKAAGALAWVVAEMMERYQKFKDHSVRNINGYNASLFEGEESMARIVVIIDELADLMMTCKKDVEEYICRLAQLARAAGIHLVVATQRPSVDVITGLIKANIPSRIAFTVSSSIDSRTILDRVGAEKLLGRGDMLYLPNGELTPFRVQGCFLSDDEVNRVTDFMKRTSVVEFDPDVLEKLEESVPAVGSAPDDAEPVDVGDGEDPLLSQAIELAVQDGQTSISMLQRRLRIGHSRAGRIVDEMSRRGILSQADGSKPRQVLISREEYEEMCRFSEE
ncbi:MAG: DNA translocase FtsK [Clostridia bacterium]|nr:DNA translocase FtsK [Clostridia bacterium]